MKRVRDHGHVATAGKGKPWAEQVDTGMDELMAVLGYKIKSSDMANVAEKIEKLEMAAAAAAEEGASVLSADSVHYNPSDLPAWVESMLSELSNSCYFDSIPGESSSDEARFISDDDLRAIPGEAVFSKLRKDPHNVEVKRVKSEFSPGSEQLYKNPPPPTARPMLMMDSQETGVRLVHTLMACAEAVQRGNAKLADALVKHVGILAIAQIGAMRKVATYFGEALARRIYNIHPPDPLGPSFSDALHMHFYETVPYLKFAHFTANQAILEAFAGASRVRVIDFGLKQGTQWPALLQALALRPGGPPAFRLTGIGPDNADTLQEVGYKLAQLAQTIGIEFEFRGFVAKSLADLDADVLEIRQNETIAVNSVLELHRLLARPGAVEKVLTSITTLKPRVVTLVEHEASHNGVVFLERFNEALHYYSTMFDSVESARTGGQNAAAMAEAYLGRQICNVVACEGSDRVERHEPLGRWRSRMSSAGFSPIHLGSDAFKQARMLLALFGGGDGYRVEENDGCLMLGWHTRPLIATSAWRPAAAEVE